MADDRDLGRPDAEQRRLRRIMWALTAIIVVMFVAVLVYG
jgi:hypothetical protein